MHENGTVDVAISSAKRGAVPFRDTSEISGREGSDRVLGRSLYRTILRSAWSPSLGAPFAYEPADQPLCLHFIEQES